MVFPEDGETSETEREQKTQGKGSLSQHSFIFNLLKLHTVSKVISITPVVSRGITGGNFEMFGHWMDGS